MIKFCAHFALALSVALLVTGSAAAVEITLTLVPSQSSITLTGDYGGLPLIPQEGTAGTIDGDPTRPSNQSTFQGSIIVDVDNIAAPTTIQILSANVDAMVNGSWLPEEIPEGTNCPPGPGQQDGCSATNPPDPAQPADNAVKVLVGGVLDFAYGVLRDLSYNLVTEVDPDGFCHTCTMPFAPAVEPVNAQGEFSSLSQHLTYNSGFFDTWIAPLLDPNAERDRDNLTGDSAGLNQHVHTEVPDPTVPPPGDDTMVVATPMANAPPSTYVVTGNLVTLTIPVNFDIVGGLNQFADGQFVATFEIPAGLPGDHNLDGTVDAADYVAWRKDPANHGGDPGGYMAWRANFGEPGGGAGGAVPEPAGAGLAVIALVSTLLGSSRSRH